MMEMFEAAVATGGVALHGNPRFAGVSTDSRSIASGELFVTLKGDNFDGHDFVEAALNRGAAAALVAHDWYETHRLARPVLVVPDTRLALGALAAEWRRRFEIPLIGITGSNGKTTVKEMSAACLRAHATAQGFDPSLAVLATQGNLNNDIGMPLMLLRLRRPHRAAVIEMGMNHPGEIAYLAGVARPTVSLVTNAQRAHLEGMGGVLHVAQEKGEIYPPLGETGTAVINADDAYASLWRERAGAARVVTFGLEHAADFSGRYRPSGMGGVLRLDTPAGEAEFALRVLGAHNARNAVAAAAASWAAGVSLDAIVEGLQGYSGYKGRLRVSPGLNGSTVIDDSYNANPDSVRAAIDVLAAVPGRKLLVFGDMGEVGRAAAQFHDEIGGYAKSMGIDQLFAIGTHAEQAVRNFGSGGRHFPSAEALSEAVRRELAPGTTALVKGSRFMRMERVVEAIAQDKNDESGH